MTSPDFVARVSLKKILAAVFWPVHKAIKAGAFTRFWLKGGRGSTKSSFAATEIVLGVMADPDANGIAFRKVGDTVRGSLLETFLWAIDKLEVAHLWGHTSSPAVLTYKPTGQKIILKGLDEPGKLKSIRLRRGYFKFVWFEELPEFNGPEEIRSVEQSIMRGGKSFVAIYTYNPPNDPAAWVNKASEEKVPDRMVHQSTYLDVPPEWLGEQFLKDAEALRIKDILKYQHEYLGMAVGRAEQIIFSGKWQEREFDEPSLMAIYQHRFFQGADWGFANDPTTLIRCFIMIEGLNPATGKPFRNLYISHDTSAHPKGGIGVEMDDIPKLFELIPNAKKWKINADCARPETISYVKRKGFNIKGAPKWPESVEEGIEYIKSFDNIYVHPRCVNTIEELTKYSYKVDKNTQEVLPVIVDKWNHYLDALRYALADYIKIVSGAGFIEYYANEKAVADAKREAAEKAARGE